MKRLLVILGICLALFCSCILTFATDSGNKSEETGKDYSKIGAKLMHDEALGFLKMGTLDKVILKNLGVAEEKSKVIVWGADGEKHQTWLYKKNGIELDMITNGKVQLINMITIKSPCIYKTKRNVGIGSKKDDVIRKYKNEINPEDSGKEVIVAGSVYGGIIFTMRDECVESIFVGASAE